MNGFQCPLLRSWHVAHLCNEVGDTGSGDLRAMPQQSSCTESLPHRVANLHILFSHTPYRFAALPAPLRNSPWHWVDTPAGLRAAVEALSSLACVAVDIEHNAARSYLGLSCLVQLSDGYQDWFIDALALHDHLHELRPLFADVNVLKVWQIHT